MYCKYAGSPYKSIELQKKTNHIGVIFIIWTVAFVLKILIATAGNRLFFLDIDNNSFGEAMLVMLMFLVTEVIPYVPVLDTSFINILLMDFVVKPLSSS
jgi:hypothetical protein